MKRYVQASEEHSALVIRMTLNEAAAERSPGGSTMLKLRFYGVYSSNIGLIIASALQLIDNYDEIVQYPSELTAQDIEDLESIAQQAGINSGEDAIHYLDNIDVGSGEPVIFSVRFGGKLVYISGLKESQFGRMDKQFDNDETASYDAYNEYMNDIQKYMNRIGGLETSEPFSLGGIKYSAAYRYLPCIDGEGPAFIFGLIPASDTFDISPQDSATFIRKLNRAAKQFNELEVAKVNPIELDNVPVFETDPARWDASIDVIYSGVRPSVAALRRAKRNGSEYVYVETKYLS